MYYRYLIIFGCISATYVNYGACDESYHDHSKIKIHPNNVTALQGKSARMKCRVDLPTASHVQWRIDEYLMGKWEPGTPSYPNDMVQLTTEEISLGIYDIVISNVSWQKYANSKFQCQVVEERLASKEATLTVIVPLSQLTLIPTPKDEVIHLSVIEKGNISCESNFATTGTMLSWTFDGDFLNEPEAIQTSYQKLTSDNKRAFLVKVISTLHFGLRRVLHEDNATMVRQRQLKRRELDVRQKIQRSKLESMYEVVHHVTCIASNENLEMDVLRKSAWIVSGEKALLGHRSEILKSDNTMTYIWIALGCGVFLAVTILLVGCFAVRRCSPPPPPTAVHYEENRKVICAAELFQTSNLCSEEQATDDGTLRSCGNIHTLHGQATDNILDTDPRFTTRALDTFAQGDGVARSKKDDRTSTASLKSISTTTNSSLRDDMVNYLSRPSFCGNDGNVMSQKTSSTIPRQYEARSAYRGWQSSIDRNPVPASAKITTSIDNVESDDLPLPPPPNDPSLKNQENDTPCLPPPMPAINDLSSVVPSEDFYPTLSRYQPRYNVVSHCPVIQYGGIEEASSPSASDTNDAQFDYDRLPGSLV